MTITHSVANAHHKEVWPDGLRITEAVSASTLGAESKCAPQLDMLRSASVYLHAIWKWLERKRTQQLSSRRLRLAETISLGEKRCLSIVQVDGAQFLIGCSTGSVQLLAVLDKKEDIANRSAGIERAL